eukprot:12882047-Prorocentrum_lima.AAC.1
MRKVHQQFFIAAQHLTPEELMKQKIHIILPQVMDSLELPNTQMTTGSSRGSHASPQLDG